MPAPAVTGVGIGRVLEAADGLGGAQHGAENALGVDSHQRPIAFLDFDDVVLDGHRVKVES
jgi:hypothetical protein